MDVHIGVETAAGAITRRVHARVGLVGNPSDGYGGAVLGTIVPGIAATVIAQPAASVELCGGAATEQWPSMTAWRVHAGDAGHVGEQRIISAALWTLVEHLRSPGRADLPIDELGVRLTWSSDVPRSVGLAGSSALAVGVIGATSALWNVPLDPRVVAALALSAERDVLGIAAGWQDRIIQSFDCSLLVDAAAIDLVDGCSVPVVSCLAPRAPVSLLVGWHDAGSTSSDDYHAPLRAMAPALAAPMEHLAGLARHAALAFAAGNVAELARAVDEGWTVRQACAPLRADHADLVEMVRATGLAATTPGSGGAVVAVCTDDATGTIAALERTGCSWRRFDVPVGQV